MDCDDMADGNSILTGIQQTPSNNRAICIALIKHTTAQASFNSGAQFTIEKPITLDLALRALRAAIRLWWLSSIVISAIRWMPRVT